MHNDRDFQQQDNSRGTDLHSEWGIIIVIIINTRRRIISGTVTRPFRSVRHVWLHQRCKKKKPSKRPGSERIWDRKTGKWVLIHSGPFSALQHNKATQILHPEVTKHPTELQESIPRRKQQPSRPSKLPAVSGRFSMTNTHYPLLYYLSQYFPVPPPSSLFTLLCVYLLEAIMSMTHSTAFHYCLDQWRWL